MVNKYLSAVAIASMVFATSCSSDDFDSLQDGAESMVTLTAQLPDGLQSRAFGDGTTAQTLSYAVYVQNNGTWTLTDVTSTDEAINLSKTVNLRLTNGQTYQVVFWADAPNSIYDFDMENRKVVANYDGVFSNDENLDAFFGTETIIVNGASSSTVKLTRPFAQLNIGASDIAATSESGRPVAKTSVKVNTYNTLNFDGSVEGEEEVTFALNDIPASENFPVEGYDYLAMNYLLMSADKKSDNTVTFSCDVENLPARTFQNVPLQRNYRTNIYGALLTSMNDFNVVITPGFNEPSTNITFWDGQTMTEPQKVEGVYQVATAAEWAWISQNVTSTGVHINLLNDIDFGGNMIGAIAWLGSLEGNGKTLSNMTVSIDKTVGGASGQPSIGLFKDCIDASSVSVKDLTIKNLKIDNNNKKIVTGGLLGEVNFSPNTTVTIENVTIDNADIQGVSKVGGLIGMVSVCNKVYVKGTTVKNSYIHNYSVAEESGYVCGLIGAVQNETRIDYNTKLENNTILGVYAGDAYNRPSNSIDAVAAKRGNPQHFVNNAHVIGGSVTTQAIGDLTISTAEELKAFADAVNAGNYFDGKVVVLANDIDLGGIEWKPIGQTSGDTPASPARYFLGTFDGGNHTISNFKITAYEQRVSGTYASGFFGFLDAGNANVVNLNLDNVIVKGHHWCGALVGYLSEGIISNCTVTNAQIECTYLDSEASGDKAGVITGYINDGLIKNCQAEYSSVKAGRDAGQIVGAARPDQVSNCSAVNVSVSRYNEQGTGANIREEVIGRVL